MLAPLLIHRYPSKHPLISHFPSLVQGTQPSRVLTHYLPVLDKNLIASRGVLTCSTDGVIAFDLR